MKTLAASLRSGGLLRCPWCGNEKLFSDLFQMREKCPACGLTFEPEAGYYVGAIYLNFGATVLPAIGAYFLLYAYTTISLAGQLLIGCGFCLVVPFLAYRHSKSFWLNLDYYVCQRTGQFGKEDFRENPWLQHPPSK